MSPDDAAAVHAPPIGELVFLGTGTSHGIPVIGCGCGVCTSSDPRNQRTRSAVALGLSRGVLLIDTPPELRIQLVRERIGVIDAVLLTHAHADHLFGLDDLRIFPYYTGRDLPLYSTQEVQALVLKTFAYAFDPEVQAYPAGGVPQLDLRIFSDYGGFDVLDQHVVALPLEHGRARSTGFRFGNLAYCTDFNRMPEATFERLAGLDTLIIGCLRYHPHVAHLSLDEALELVEQLQPKSTYFTHISHALDHETVSANLPPHVRLAYDGLRIPLTI